MTDRAVVLAVVAALGSVAAIGLAGVVWLASTNVAGETLAVVVGPVGVAIGALASVLSSTRTSPPKD